MMRMTTPMAISTSRLRRYMASLLQAGGQDPSASIITEIESRTQFRYSLRNSLLLSINQDHRPTCKERINNEVDLHIFVIYVIIIIISMYHYHLTCKERINNEVDPIGGVSSTAAFVEAAFVNLVRLQDYF